MKINDGQLCWFWGSDETKKVIGTYNSGIGSAIGYYPCSVIVPEEVVDYNNGWDSYQDTYYHRNCKPLSFEEVCKFLKKCK